MLIAARSTRLANLALLDDAVYDMASELFVREMFRNSIFVFLVRRQARARTVSQDSLMSMLFGVGSKPPVVSAM